jgi:outer membrane protein assembly factor BamB
MTDDILPEFDEQPSFGSGSLLEQAQKLKEIKQLIESGNKIEAIKRYRQTFGCGLKEAKDAVENIEAGRPVVFTGYQNASLGFDGEEAVKVAKTLGLSFFGIVLAILLFVGAIVAVVLYNVSNTINKSISSIKMPPIPAATKPSATPEKPQFARETFRFGGAGMGAGQFKDNRSVAVDSDGNIYSAEYTGGRIQAFDAQGKFKKLLMVDEERALLDMVADRSGNLFVLMVGTIYRFDTKTGELAGKIDKFYGEDLAVGLDGLLYAVVRPGDIVAMTPEGKEVKRFKDIAAQANLKHPDIQSITLDGEGNIYALDRSGYYVLKFSKDGKYINRFGGKSESGRKDVKGVFDFFPNDIAVDGKGNVFVSMVNNILVFDTNGAYVDSFNTTQAFGMTVTDKNELWVACRPFVVKYETK